MVWGSLMIEEKPNTLYDNINLGLQGEGTPELPKELEKYMGEALEKLLNKDFSDLHGELYERERVCLVALRMKGQIYDIDIYDKFIKDYVLRSVAYKRKRAEETVKVLEGLHQYNRTSWSQKIKQRLLGGGGI